MPGVEMPHNFCVQRTRVAVVLIAIAMADEQPGAAVARPLAKDRSASLKENGHALSLVPLRCSQSRSAPQATYPDKLQLFDVPALWCSLGLLQRQRRETDGTRRSDGQLQLGTEHAEVHQVQVMWVRHAMEEAPCGR
jgi:hypothetical protein